LKSNLKAHCSLTVALVLAAVAAVDAAVIDKQNNTTDLNLTGSWVGGVVPKTNDIALWRSIVLSANTVDLGTNLGWDGIRITNPAGTVTLNSRGGYPLTLGASGVDMGVATRDLAVNCGLRLGGAQTWNIGASRKLTLTGELGGVGSPTLTKSGSGSLMLNGTNSSFLGLTVVSNGILGGTGVLSGPLLIASAGTLSPGNPIGRLVVSNSLTLQGAVRMELSKTAGLVTCDLVGGLNSVAYGGALVVSNTTVAALVEGDTARLFEAEDYSGTFASIVLPALSSGLSWDTSRLLVDGSIRIVAAGPPYIVVQPTNVFSILGQTAVFAVAAGGRQPLAYQWFRDGVALLGSTTALLTLPNLQRADVAGYQAVVSNSFGSLTSQVAVLSASLATVDSFAPATDGEVYAMAVQTDGRVLVAGAFATLGGQAHANIGRLNADGSVDPTFNAQAGSSIYSLAVQADGRILVGGSFGSLGGQSRSYIGRLNADGSADLTFNPGANGYVYSLAVQHNFQSVLGLKTS
jgi:uncharacterized delta-60 repeat protein